jgi:hypothetical protein
MELFDSQYVNFIHGVNYNMFAISADGQRFLIPRPASAWADMDDSVTVILNWPLLLKK